MNPDQAPEKRPAAEERAAAADLSHVDAQLDAARSKTIFADLSHCGLIRFSGDDARDFLNGQLSCDVAGLEPWHARYGSYSTPQGRMLASFLLWREAAVFFMQLPGSMREATQQRLAMHILRSKVKAEDASAAHVLIGVAGKDAAGILSPLFAELPGEPLSLTNTEGASVLRLAADRYQIIASPERAPALRSALDRDAVSAGPAVWDWLDIRAGIPFIMPATREQFVPQMANLDAIGGVSFNKGCYPGQEIVARMHYLGRLKQRMYLASVAADVAPQPGDKLYSAGTGAQACGTVVNAAAAPDGGFDMLAVMQIESAQQGDVHWKSPEGPRLKFMELPYSI